MGFLFHLIIVAVSTIVTLWTYKTHKPISATARRLSMTIVGKEDESSGKKKDESFEDEKEDVEDINLNTSLENRDGCRTMVDTTTLNEMKNSHTEIKNSQSEMKNSQSEMRTEVKEVKNTLTEMKNADTEIMTEFTEVKQLLAEWGMKRCKRI